MTKFYHFNRNNYVEHINNAWAVHKMHATHIIRVSISIQMLRSSSICSDVPKKSGMCVQTIKHHSDHECISALFLPHLENFNFFNFFLCRKHFFWIKIEIFQLSTKFWIDFISLFLQSDLICVTTSSTAIMEWAYKCHSIHLFY